MMSWVVCLALLAPGCGDGELTLGEYAEQLEEVVTTMNQRISDLDADLESEPLTIEGTQRYFEEKIAARDELLEGFRAIEPPEEAAEMHAAALDIVTKLADAERALAQQADEIETVDELSELWDTQASLAVDAVDEQARAFCAAAQAQFDSSADRAAAFEGQPWIPPELKEVVQVFFGCPE
ncbi:MAG: hypothetical protein GY708_09410 [Actinomycetia bacterium]|nr:hypothetical protein [Actinomycetes bacterium]MCP5035483.1 hypothetical protein [Actinomycetes bacterium]